jgi:hypothetical protein
LFTPFKGVPNSKAYPKKNMWLCLSGHDCPILKNPRVPEHIGFQKKDTRKEFLDARSPNVFLLLRVSISNELSNRDSLTDSARDRGHK